MNSSDNNFISPCIEKWKSQLLDLSARNRALFYRPTRTTLTIHSDPDAVWNDIVGEGSLTLSEASLVPVEDDEEKASSVFEDALRRSKAIAEIARTFNDEQGVHVTHAVFGWLKWTDEKRPPGPRDPTVTLRSGRTARVVRSPLVFVPVNLQRESRGWKVTLEQNAAIESNITLEHAVNELYGLKIEFAGEEIDPKTVLDYWRTAIQGKEHWEVYNGDNVIIDTFSFKKIAILKEIERSSEQISNQPVLRALCGDPNALVDAPSVPDYSSLDDALSKEDLNLVVPADASQVRALLAVNRGSNLVIQGPPGTGKSQTITNIVSTMLAQGKKILFVAEKRQARNIVVDNLTREGLGELVLHITEEVQGRRSSSSSKQDIADQLGDILNRGPGYYDFKADFAVDQERIKDQLNRYCHKLHTPLGPSAVSKPFDLLRRWANAVDDYPANLAGQIYLPDISDVNDSWIRGALEVASSVDDLGEATLSSALGPWLDSRLLSIDEENQQQISDALAVLAACADELDRIINVHGQPTTYGVGECDLPTADQLVTTLATIGRHYATKRKFMGFCSRKFWRTKGDFDAFIKSGGQAPELAQATATKLATSLETIRQARDIVAVAFSDLDTNDNAGDLSLNAKWFLSSIDTAGAAVRVRSVCLATGDGLLAQALLDIVKARLSGQRVRRLLELALAKNWAKEAIEHDSTLGLGGVVLSRQVDALRNAEQEALVLARVQALNAAAPYRPSHADYAVPGGDLQVLRSQINAKKRRPLRWLFSRSGVKILQIKPCIVASPLAVAQFLHSDAFQFDLVIFDEASQIPTADAVIPISHAKQVVVVGDSEQMPPTSFFDSTTGAVDDGITYESVLQECQSLLPSRRLLWHYRSEDERLIAFSNRSFYNGDLLTFPSSWESHPELGVKFVYLPHAIYGRGGSRANPEEAEQVIKILEHELAAGGDSTVGVTAMSIAQSTEIQSRVELAAETSEILQSWLDQGGRARNLETIQGDEFDVSILSFGYGKDPSGTPQLNFGPLSRDDGYRRLNVAITRARKKTIVVTSIRASDIPVGRVSTGGQLVRSYLDYAERGPVALGDDLRAPIVDVFDSPFEEEVARHIRSLGWEVDTQVGVSRYRVDLGVRHPELPGKYLAGIECDGATYHSGETAHDRDIGRQKILERRDWNIYRIWSTDWYRSRERVVADLHSYLRGLLGQDDSDTDQPKRQGPLFPMGNSLQSPEFRPLDRGLEPGTLPYSTANAPGRGPGGSSGIETFGEWLVDNLGHQGPFTFGEIYSMGERAGPFSYQEVNSLLDRLDSEGLVKVCGGSLWNSDFEPRHVPVKIAWTSGVRQFEFYSDEELLRAMELASCTSVPIRTEDVARAAARLLGYPKTTSKIRERLEGLLLRGVQEGYLTVEGDSFRSRPTMNINNSRYLLDLLGKQSENLPSPPAAIAQPTSSKATPSSSRKTHRLEPEPALFRDAQQFNRPLRVRYRDYFGAITERTVDIHKVTKKYVYTYDHLRRAERTFRIDRVLSVTWADASKQ